MGNNNNNYLFLILLIIIIISNIILYKGIQYCINSLEEIKFYVSEDGYLDNE